MIYDIWYNYGISSIHHVLLPILLVIIERDLIITACKIGNKSKSKDIGARSVAQVLFMFMLLCLFILLCHYIYLHLYLARAILGLTAV